MSQKLLIYPLCGGGHFLKWCLLLSPEQDHDWPTHNESSNMNYIRNQVYHHNRTWQNYTTVERGLDNTKRNLEYDIKIDHTKYEHIWLPQHTAWCYHADEMGRVAWQHFVDINLFALAGDESEWETAQDQYNMTVLRESGGMTYDAGTDIHDEVPVISYTNTEIRNKQYQTQYQNSHNAFFDIDWIWAGFDENKYTELCEFFDLTPVIDQAEECWNIYANLRNKQIRTFHHWLENTLPDKLKYLKQIQYKYHTK